MSIGYSRRKHGVWGLAGGAPASRSSAPTGSMRARSLPAVKLAKGDVARIIAAQGGGWGAASPSPPDGENFG
jgi:N-methylhydantoinase B/oxoprolinase/acetone carboxylase alpha subunit